MSSLTLLAEMWSAVKESVISSDRASVADNVVSLLVDHDISPEEIRRAFRAEGDIIDALKFYMDNDEAWVEDEDEETEIEYSFEDHDDEDEDW